MRENVPILSVLRPKTVERFLVKLRLDGECKVFTGMKNRNRYGFVPVMWGGVRFPILAHRLAWALNAGEDPPADRIVCHRCNNPPCCNPEHLYLGTPRENTNDTMAAGNIRRGENHPLFGVKGAAHPRARYSQAEKDAAIEALRSDCNFSELFRKTKIPRDTLTRWWREYEAECGRK